MWLIHNSLCLNPTKSDAIVFRPSRQQDTHTNECWYNLGLWLSYYTIIDFEKSWSWKQYVTFFWVWHKLTGGARAWQQGAHNLASNGTSWLFSDAKWPYAQEWAACGHDPEIRARHQGAPTSFCAAWPSYRAYLWLSLVNYLLTERAASAWHRACKHWDTGIMGMQVRSCALKITTTVLDLFITPKKHIKQWRWNLLHT